METLVKYANRKLYSKLLAGHINLGYVEELINDCKPFEVIDLEGNDITSNICKALIIKLIKEDNLKKAHDIMEYMNE